MSEEQAGTPEQQPEHDHAPPPINGELLSELGDRSAVAEGEPLSWKAEQAVAGRYYDKTGVPTDEWGVKQLHHFSVGTILGSIPGAIDLYSKKVPERFWDQDVIEETILASVQCPSDCGRRTLVPLGAINSCGTAGAPGENGCGRSFIYVGSPGQNGRRAVFAAFSPEASVNAPTPAAP